MSYIFLITIAIAFYLTFMRKDIIIKLIGNFLLIIISFFIFSNGFVVFDYTLKNTFTDAFATAFLGLAIYNIYKIAI